jgi:hypothetical protein
VHEYLRHLESVGFRGAPRPLGVEGEREILTFLDGDVAADPQWNPGRGLQLPLTNNQIIALTERYAGKPAARRFALVSGGHLEWSNRQDLWMGCGLPIRRSGTARGRQG